MSANIPFKGFTPETLSFFLQLSQNNNKAWFDAHRQQYEQAVLNPSRALPAFYRNHMKQKCVLKFLLKISLNGRLYGTYIVNRF